MTEANERDNYRGKPKKSELLPIGAKAREVLEVLAAMYRAIENPEDIGNDDQRR